MMEFIGMFLDWAKHNPYQALLLVSVGFLIRVIARDRIDRSRRIGECEDAHLERDIVDLDSMHVLSRIVGLMSSTTGGKRKPPPEYAELETEVAGIIKRKQELNQRMLARRSVERERDEKALQFKVPDWVHGKRGD